MAWDTSYDVDSTVAGLFEDVYRDVVDAVMTPHFGLSAWRAVMDATNVIVDFYSLVDRVLLDGGRDAAADNADGGFDWFPGSTRDECVAAAVNASLERADGQQHQQQQRLRWGARRSVVMKNVLFDGKLPGFLGVDHGPIELPGSRATIVQGAMFEAHGRTTTFCPSYRCVTDLSTPVLHTALAGGVSGSPFSNLYKSDLANWIGFTYKLLKLN